MIKGFHHLGIALHTDCTTNLSKLIIKTGIPIIENLGKIKILISMFKVEL